MGVIGYMASVGYKHIPGGHQARGSYIDYMASVGLEDT